MTNIVPSDKIESIVGVSRHPDRHYARAVSAEQTVYVLHSRQCLESGIDLRECPFSLALDQGIDTDDWADAEDRPVLVGILGGRLTPAFGPTVRIADSVPGHKMCCVCFEFTPFDELYVDGDGQRWDLCNTCAAKENLAERIFPLLGVQPKDPD